MASMWSEIEDIVEIAATSDDPVLRYASAYFLMWRNEYLTESDGLRDLEFERLGAEVSQWQKANVRIDPNIAILLGSQLSDIWMLRGNFELARQHGRRVHLLTKQLDNSAMERATLASLGYLTCMAGYVDDGISLVLRTAAQTIDLSAERFVGGEINTHSDRQLAVELADCYEFTRDWTQAATVLRIVNSLISPGATASRIQNLWALARCYSRVGEHTMADELISQAPLALPNAGLGIEFKYARTLIVQDAACGNTAAALEACTELIERVNQPSRVNLHKEIADEAARIARDADEPEYCIAVLEPIDHFNGPVLPLLGVFACRDLAWAYRRIGRPNAARHYQRLAHVGQRRFHQHDGDADVGETPVPAALISAREVHRVARLAQLGEAQSLYRGLGAVVHDLRTPLQSLELAFSCPTAPISVLPIRPIVESINQTLDELLRDIEMHPSVPVEHVRLGDIVDDVIATFRSTAERKSVDLDATIAIDLSCTASVPMLARILSNLVSNAIKYSPAHSTVHLSATALGADIVDLHVEDSGPGVSTDEIERLFQWGGTGSAQPTGGEPQHGIGLYTAKRLANLLGATIRCHARTATTRSAFSIRLRRAGSSQGVGLSPEREPGRTVPQRATN